MRIPMTSNSPCGPVGVIPACIFLVTCLCSLAPQATACQQFVEVGDEPVYRFERPLFNGMGATSLEDLRGKPVFIEFWGRKGASVDDSMREALAWQEAYGDDLTMLFVEVKGAADPQVISLALKKKWLGGAAIWTTEKPCKVGLRGALPQFVLLSSEGVVLLKGTTQSFELGYRNELVETIEDTLGAEVERRRSGPAVLPTNLAQSWKEFSKGNIEEALRIASGLEADPESGDTAAAETLAAFRSRIDRRLTRAAWQTDNGYLLQAEKELGRLEGRITSERALETRHQALIEALRRESLQAEWKAAKELAKLEKRLYAQGSKSVLVKLLRKLADKHAGTQSAKRAEYLFEAAQLSPFK
jgi:hypothetical protein